jgi:hypothetical protein
LAARRSLPVPSTEEIAAIGDAVSLSEAWTQWQTGHAGSAGIIETTTPAAAKRPILKWRSFVLKSAAVAAAAVLGFVVGERWLRLPDAGAQSSAATATQAWVPVTDSVVVAAYAKLSRIVMDDAPAPPRLSAADMATVIFLSPRRRHALVDSLEARVDSLLWIRGRLRGASRFELGGELAMLRRGVAELRVAHLAIDGVEADSARVARLVIGVRSRTAPADRIRFEVPGLVTELAIDDGSIRMRR